MPTQVVTDGKLWMVEIVGWIVNHADLLHDAARCVVLRHGERHDFTEAQPAECVARDGLGALGGEARAPMLSRKPPTYLDAGGKMRVERGHGKPDEADERIVRVVKALGREEAEAMPLEARSNSRCQAIALTSPECRRQVARDLRIGVQGGEGRQVLIAPRTQEQTRSHDDASIPFDSTPRAAVESKHHAIVTPEAATFDGAEPQTLVETSCTIVRHQGIDDEGVDGAIGKATLDGEPHRLRAETTTEMSVFADPDIDRTEPLGAIAPIMTILTCRIDNLDKTDRHALRLYDELLAPRRTTHQIRLPTPIVRALRGDDMGRRIPTSKQLEVTQRGRTQAHHRIMIVFVVLV